MFGGMRFKCCFALFIGFRRVKMCCQTSRIYVCWWERELVIKPKLLEAEILHEVLFETIDNDG